MITFKVVNWSFNQDTVEYYDVMPHFRYEYQKLRKKDRPTTFEDVKLFILREARCQFWSRCEYETIIAGTPAPKDESGVYVSGWPQNRREVKIDVFDQIEQNIDVITTLFMKEL